jgi:hypothetical protein
MPKYKVQLCRTYYAFADVVVEADSYKDAEILALKNPPDDFHGMQMEGEDKAVSCDKVIELPKECGTCNNYSFNRITYWCDKGHTPTPTCNHTGHETCKDYRKGKSHCVDS